MSEVGMDILTTVCEAGGIVGVIGLVLALLIKMMKRNGCTLRCFHCNGKPFIELDCEQGSAQKRYLPGGSPEGSPSDSSIELDLSEVQTRHVKPSDIIIKH